MTSHILIRGDVPEVSPFGVERWWTGSIGFVLRSIGLKNVFMIPAFFSILGGSPNLIIVLRENFFNRSIGIILLSPAIEVAFHKIEELRVVGLINSGIFDD